MNILAFIVPVLSLIIPPLIMRQYSRKILEENIPKENKIHKGAKVMILCIFLTAVIYIFSLIFLGLLEKTMEFVSAHVTNVFLGAIVFAGVLFLPFLISLMFTILEASRIEVEIKGLNVETPEVVKQILKVFAITLVPGLLWIAVYALLPGGIKKNTPAEMGIFAVYILTFFALAPYWTRLFGKRRPLEEPLRSELLKFCESLGFKVRDIQVTGKKKYKVANAGVTGIIPGYRYIFVTEYMLETFGPEEIKAVIAHEIGHIKGKHLWINAVIAIGWFAFWMGLVFLLVKLNVNFLSPAVFFGAFLSAYIVYFIFIQGRISMRNEFKADEYAAKVVGKETVIKTLEKLAEVNLTPKRTGKLFSFLSLHPSIEERIRHLEEAGL